MIISRKLNLSVLLVVISYFSLAQTPTNTKSYLMETTVRVPNKTNVSQLIGLPVEDANVLIKYYDALGRTNQDVHWQGSPLKQDIVQAIEYDKHGQQTRKYLSYPSVNTTGAFNSNALQSGAGVLGFYNPSPGGISGVQMSNGIVRNTMPFSQTKVEHSALNRVLEVGSSGPIWQPYDATSSLSGHTKKIEYTFNSNADNVWLYKALTNTTVGYGHHRILSSVGLYNENELYLTISRGENWTNADGKAGTIEEYKNKNGQVVLTRAFNKLPNTNIETLSTYYVYDIYGNLSFVLPPALNPDAGSFTHAELDNFCYQYRYDGRKRLIEKQLPGKGWEYLVYNKLDQQVLSQDASQQANNTWAFAKYDVHGRKILSGLLNSTTDRSEWQANIDGQTGSLWEARDDLNVNGTGTGYTNVVLPNSGINQVLAVNYYDDYNFYGNTFGQPVNPQITGNEVKNLSTGNKINTLGTANLLLSVNYYNSDRKLVWTKSINHVGGSDITSFDYEFTGELKSVTKNHTAHTTSVSIANSYFYDHVGRKISTKQNTNNQGEIILNEFTFNEIGQVKEKRLHVVGGMPMQKINYAYNERGWLTKLNDPTNVTADKVFGEELNYANKEDAYNGNIGAITWQTKVPDSYGLTQVQQSYVYDYDHLDRLIKADYVTPGLTGRYNEEITYDNMGNIAAFKRYGGQLSPLHDFSYGYGTGTLKSNKLLSVTNAVSAIQTNYSYDINGNQKTNSSTGITNITYNNLNLPTSFEQGVGGPQLNFTYNALGTKLSKQLAGSTTDYIGGFQYTNGTLDFISTEEGRVVPGSTYTYEYFITDHLGNTRAIVKEDGTIKQLQDYYPFGLEMNIGNSFNSTPHNYYMYNGKEKQVELGLNQLDYGARFYDPLVGRWNVIDPESETHHDHSPYNYVANNPISRVDPDGRNWWQYGQKMINKYTNDNLREMYLASGQAGLQAQKDAQWRSFKKAWYNDVKEYVHETYIARRENRSNGGGNEIDGSSFGGLFSKVVGAGLLFTPFGSVGALAKAGRDQNYAAGAVALIGFAGEVSAIASMGSRVASAGSRAEGITRSGSSPGTSLAKYWPENGGAIGAWTDDVASVGAVYSRYGPTYGSYASPVEVPFLGRSLSPVTSASDYFEFEIMKSFPIKTSQIGPAFGQIGYGLQIKTPIGINYLQDFGYIRPIKK